MQALMRMRFGPYTFLQNPAQLQVENRALQQEERAEPMRAYLTRFDYTCTTARDGVQYSFTFTEDCDRAPRYAPYGSTRVRQGENAFDIAARTGVSVDTIVALSLIHI